MAQKKKITIIAKVSLYSMVLAALLTTEGTLAASKSKKTANDTQIERQVIAGPHLDFTTLIKDIKVNRDSEGPYVDLRVSPTFHAYEERPADKIRDLKVHEVVDYLNPRNSHNFVYVVSVNELPNHVAFKGTVEAGSEPDSIRIRLSSDPYKEERYGLLQDFVTARAQNPKTHSLFRIMNYEAGTSAEASIPEKDRTDYVFFARKGFSLQKGEVGQPYKATFKGVDAGTLLSVNGRDQTQITIPDFQKIWTAGGATSFQAAGPNGDWVSYDDADSCQEYRMKFSNPVYDRGKKELSFDVTPLIDPKTNKLLIPGLLEDGERIDMDGPLKLYLDFGVIGGGIG